MSKLSNRIKHAWEECPRHEKIAVIVMYIISALELIASAIIWIR